MKKIAFLLLLTTVYTHQHNKQKVVHECIHDQFDVSKQVPSDYLETFDEVYGDRTLQNSKPEPIRITVDYKEFDNPKNGELTPVIRNYLMKIMEAAQLYLGKLIKVNRRTKPIKMSWGDVCYDVPVARDITEGGIVDSDLHIYVTYGNEPNSTYLASATWCQLDPNPVVGRVKLNIGTMQIKLDDPQSFQDNFSTSLHEILHILGFSGYGIKYWIDPDTGKPYGDDNAYKIIKQEDRWDAKGVNKVFSKNILRVARNHYGYNSIDGMYLENQGGGGSMGSHWERDLLGNEFMTASIVYGTFSISEFTAALLLDTGYYAEINSNMLNPLFWGKNKGCDFFNKSCNTDQNFPEFPDQSVTKSCDFYSQSIGERGNSDTFSQCKTIGSGGYSCERDEIFSPDYKLRMNTGPGSRCFVSNAAFKGESDQEMQGRCFKAKCATDNQSIEVFVWGTEKVNCKYPNQVINLDTETKNTQGFMKCPGDFDMFCGFPKTCPKQCSNNGICNNGICICLNGWAGEDCSKQCPTQFSWDGSRCVPRCPSGQYKNNDNVCRANCPYKYYKDASTSSCELCHVNCAVCNGPLNNQCTVCNNGYSLQGNACVELKCHNCCITCSGPAANQCLTCGEGKYLDQNKICQPCRSPCKNCQNSTQCTSCMSGYFMDQFTGQCNQNSTCDRSCQTCSAWRDPNSCTSCKEGYILINGRCTQCDRGCKKCSGQTNNCSECISNFTYDAQNKRCFLECDSSCQECSEAKNSKACILCGFGKYLKDGQCLACDPICNYCKDSPNFCIQCVYGKKLDAEKGTCTNICKSDEFVDTNQNCRRCASPCASCSYDESYCNSCISGYVLDPERYSCKPLNPECHPSCNTCYKYNDEKGCDSCRAGMYFSNYQCLQCPKGCETCYNPNTCYSCSNGYELQGQKCVEKKSTQCHSSCKTCSGPASGNRTFCTSCYDGQYLNGDSCLSCQIPCKTCSGTSQSCTSCDENQYTLNQRNKTCDSKICHSSCRTCTKPNDSFSCSSCSDGFVLNGSTCQSCSQNCKTCSNNPNFCTSCSSGFVLNNGQCQKQSVTPNKCDPSCTTCFRDNDALGCLTCGNNQWLQTNSDRSLARCLPCDSSCNGCVDTYRCTACSGENVLDGNGYCVPCPSDKKFQNGKCVDAVKRNRKSVISLTCDYTCSTCVGTYYDQCSSCAGNRVLLKRRDDLNYGYCVCPEGTSDVNQPMCQVSNNLQSNIKSTTSTTFAASAATSAVVSASTSNPVSALGVMEFSQSVSYLSYVNKKSAVGFDETMNAVSYSHASNFFDLESYALQDAENERQIKKTRRLQQEDASIDIDEEDEEEVRNPKFSQFHKTQLFLINALVLIIINSAVWVISGILSLINAGQDKSSLFFKLRRIYNISIPIVVFTLSSQEFSLLMFLQMLNLKTITGLQILSSIFSFLTLFYILGFTAFLFYCLEYKKVLSSQYGDNLVWQQRFYLIHKYIKQDNFFTRNFVQITVLRKVLISFITACVVSSPIAQISLLILCYTTFLIYLTVCRPFKSNLYTAMMIILDSIIVLIHVLYCIMFAYEGDSEKEKVISLMMLFLTFSVFFAYLIYTLVIIGKICYSLYRKWQDKNSGNKTFVKRPQSNENNHVIIDQQMNNNGEKNIGPSSSASQSLNHIDQNMIFSDEVLVQN